MPCGASGVILAGGTSRRMGHDKAFLELAGQPLIAWIAEQLRIVVDEVIVAADDTERYAPFADRCVPDLYPGVGTLGGIHAGLEAASQELALVVGCDMPFLKPDLLTWFVDAAGEADLVVLKHDLGLEPLHAVYAKSCLPAIESTIRSGERCAFAFYDQIHVRYVHPDEIAPLDPALSSFCNINTPDQWREALIRGYDPPQETAPPSEMPSGPPVASQGSRAACRSNHVRDPLPRPTSDRLQLDSRAGRR